MSYGNQMEVKCESSLSSMQETARQRLERRKKDLLSHLEDVNEAIGLLEKYPDMERLTDLLRRTI